MSRRDDERVADILDAASDIAEIIDLGRDAWDKDRIRQLAVERLLEIIGEAANSLSEDFRAQHPGVPWRDIIGLRVVLAHPYHRVDPNQVWVIAATEIPGLVQDIRPRWLMDRLPSCTLASVTAAVTNCRTDRRIFVSAGPGRDALKVMPEFQFCILGRQVGTVAYMRWVWRTRPVLCRPGSEGDRAPIRSAAHEAIVCRSRTRVLVREFRRCGASRTQV